MQIHPLFSVKKAAEVLGVEKQFLREQLENGAIRGEKRRVGERDKWFIYHGEVKDLRDTKRLQELKEKAKRISTEGLKEFFDEADTLAQENETDHTTGESVASAENTPVTSPDYLPGQTSSDFHLNEAAFDTSASGRPGDDDQSLLDTTGISASSTTLQAEGLVLSELAELDALVLSNDEPLFAENNFYVDPEQANQGVSGKTAITLDAVLQKLTVEFAYRLAEERTRVCELEQLLEAKEESLRRLPDLERLLEDEQQKLLAEQTKLEEEQTQRRAHEDQVAVLQKRIAELETRKSSTKSWWRKIFG
jgi:hypothetical protein